MAFAFGSAASAVSTSGGGGGGAGGVVIPASPTAAAARWAATWTVTADAASGSVTASCGSSGGGGGGGGVWASFCATAVPTPVLAALLVSAGGCGCTVDLAVDVDTFQPVAVIGTRATVVVPGSGKAGGDGGHDIRAPVRCARAARAVAEP